MDASYKRAAPRCKRIALQSTSLTGVLLLGCLPAYAQSNPQAPLPATIEAVDENGVDVVSGALITHGAQHSIGTRESGLSISRQLSTSAGAYSDLLQDEVSGGMYQYTDLNNPSRNHLAVTFGYSTYRYKLVNGTYQSYKGTIPAFSCAGTSCTLSLMDGTVAQYSTSLTGNDRFRGSSGLVTRVDRPDGVVLTYTYDSSGRRIAVQSSLGWMLKTKFTGQFGVQYQLINTGSDFCDPAAASCEQLAAYPLFSDLVDVGGNTWSGAGTAMPGYAALTRTDPRGVTLSANVSNSNPAAEPSTSDRTTSVTRASSTWTYATSYVASGTGASLGLWLTTSNGPNGIKRYVYWPEESRLLQVTDALGRKTTVSLYNAQNKPLSVVYPDATYSTSSTDPLSGGVATGGYTSFSYDARGNLTGSRKVPRNAGNDHSQDIIWSSSYPASCSNLKTCNQPDSVTDPRGSVTSYTYHSASGRIATETVTLSNGIQKQTRYEYGQFSPYIRTGSGGLQLQPAVWRLVRTRMCRTMTLATCAGQTDELITTIGYGTNNVLPVSQTVSRGDGSGAIVTSYTYDAYGNVLIEDGPRPGTDDAVYSFYDARRLKIGEISADPDGAGGLPRIATRMSYGADGQIETVVKGTVTATTWAAVQAMTALDRIETGYSTAHGKPILERRYDGGGTLLGLKQTGYDGAFRLKCSAVRMNQSAFSSPLPEACSVGTEGSQGPDRITLTDYDLTGAVTKVTKAYGTSLATAERTNGYDAASGRLAWMEDANGNRNTYEYDSFGRLFRWYFPVNTSIGTHTSSTSDFEQYGYDANSNRLSLRKRDGRTFSFTYDALNRMASKIVPDGCVVGFSCTSAPATATRDVYYGYDNMGAQIYARFDSPTGEGVTSTFDTLGWQTQSSTNMGGVTKSLDFHFDAYGNRDRITHPDGAYFQLGYDGLNRLLNASWWTAASGTVPFLGMAYNAAGFRSTTARASSNTTYLYDNIGRLSNISQNFVNGSGNDSASLLYNPANQIVSRARSSTDFSYTTSVNTDNSYVVNGLNQYKTVGTNSYSYDANGNLISDGGVSYTYDAENRLIAATSSGGVTLNYDPLGRLWQSTSGSLGSTRFLYDGDQLSIEYSGTGSINRRYMFAGQDEPILMDEGGALNCSGSRFLHTDQQGSVVALADCNGNRVSTFAYDEYGVPRAGDSLKRFQYTGQAWLPDVGMYYYKSRMYSPMLGRFLQVDPIGYDDQSNLYSYVANDPMNGRDPDGRRAIWVQDKQGNVVIQYILAFSGPDAGNTKAQNEIVNSLRSLSTPNGERIEVIVAPASSAGKRGVNTVNLSQSGYKSSCGVDTSCGQLNGSKSWIDSSANDVGQVGAHEISHNGNATDGYSEGTPGPAGERTFGVDKKPTSDIMTRRTGTSYTQQTIDEIKAGSIKTDRENNKYICAVSKEFKGCAK